MKPAIADIQVDNLCLVTDLDTYLFGKPVQRIHHGFPAAKEPGIGTT